MMFILWITAVLIVLYLAVGLTLFFGGTRRRSSAGSAVIRRIGNSLVFKGERFGVDFKITPSQVDDGEAKQRACNIVFVIDNSRSMVGAPLSLAGTAVKNLIASMPDTVSYALVLFDVHARIGCRLTRDTVKLRRVIDRMATFGDTAVHEGLAMAAGIFEADAKPGDENIVVLLSSGCGDKNFPTTPVKRLSEAGVTVYSIGVGEYDKELMETAAGDGGYFFGIDELARLSEFFDTIGRQVVNADRGTVEIIEYPVVSRAPFKIAGWGDIRPLDVRLNDPEKPYIRWVLPAASTSGAAVGYELQALKCGWYRTSAEYSPTGATHILVIPQFFLWQVFWIFLNPLFWMLMPKQHESDGASGFIGSYTLPDRAVVEPPDDLPPIKDPFVPAPRPTLVLGIGYGGGWAVSHLKRLLWEHNQDEAIHERVKTATLDSVVPYLAELCLRRPGGFFEKPPPGPLKNFLKSFGQKDEKINKSFCGDPRGRTMRFLEKNPLAAGGILKIHFNAPVSQYISHNGKTHDWLEPDILRAESVDYDTGGGTHMNRRVGRLKYILDREKLGAFESLLKTLHENYPDEPPVVCITGTLGGGTSTGMLLDVCHTLKTMAWELGMPGLSIHLFLTDAVPDDAGTEESRIERAVYVRNKTAFLGELSRFYSCRYIPFAALPGDEPIARWFDSVFWVEKKEGTSCKTDLYPQAAVLLYQWMMDKSFREFIAENARGGDKRLPVHRFRVHALFLFKRMLTGYFSARLLLNVIGGGLLGLSGVPARYSLLDSEVEPPAIENVLELLFNMPGWEAAVPRLMRDPDLITRSDENNFSRFISRGFLAEMVPDLTHWELEDFISEETRVFRELLCAWIQSVLNRCHENVHTAAPLKNKAFAVLFRALEQMDCNFNRIREMAGNIPDTESYTDHKQCFIISELTGRWVHDIRQWLTVLRRWGNAMGEGTEQYTGVCREMNRRLNVYKQAIENSHKLETPYFVFDDSLRDKLYETYFRGLEPEIQGRMQWVVNDPGSEGLMLRVASLAGVTAYSLDDLTPVLTEEIVEKLADLPGYFASDKHAWHAVTLADMVSEAQAQGDALLPEYLVSAVREIGEQSVLAFNEGTGNLLPEYGPTGVVYEHVSSVNPFIDGFFAYRLNHEEMDNGFSFDFDSVPPFIFSEEKNCFNALSVYRNVTGKEVAYPSFAVIGLCRDMKWFLGAVKACIIGNGIGSLRDGVQMVYRFESLQVPQGGESDDGDILKLLRLVIESPAPAVINILERGFDEILTLEPDEIHRRVGGTSVPLSSAVKEQLIQVASGAVTYLKNE